jgi:hypothetical protein
MLYRIAMSPDGTLIALDVARGSLIRFSAGGELLDQARLPMWFSQVGSLVAMRRDTVVISGAPSSAGLASDSAIHVFAFGDSLQHVRSFGKLPHGTDDVKRRMFGAGLLAWGGGRLLYSRRIPYEITAYSLLGRVEVSRLQTTPTPTSLEDQFVVERNATRTRYGFAPPSSEWHRISVARPLGADLVIVTRTEGAARQVWDLLDRSTLRRTGSVPYPRWEAALSLLGIDEDGSRLIASTTCDEEPCLVAMRFAVGR